MMKKILFPTLFWSVLFLVMAIVPYSVPQWDGISSADVDGLRFGAAFPTVFGGGIVGMDECTCSGGMRIVVGPPRPMDLLFQPGVSTLFSLYTLLPSEYVLGAYIPSTPATPAVCTRGTTVCVPIPVAGTITLVGTTFLSFGGVF